MSLIKLRISSQQAKISSLGSSLGQHGLNSKEVCDILNKNVEFKEGLPLCVKINVITKSKYTLSISQPSVKYLLSKCNGITLKVLYEISLLFKEKDKEKVCKQLLGSCRSMGIVL